MGKKRYPDPYLDLRKFAIVEEKYTYKPVQCNTFGCGVYLSLLEQLSGNVCSDCYIKKQDITFLIKLKL